LIGAVGSGWRLRVPIAAGCTATVSLLDENVYELASGHDDPIEIVASELSSAAVPGWATVLRTLRDQGQVLPGLSISIDDSRSPDAANRAIAAAISQLCGLPLQLAGVAEGQALLSDPNSLDVETLPFQPKRVGLQLLVVDCRVADRSREHDCAQAASELGVSSLHEIGLDDLDAAMARLSNEKLGRRVRHVVTENDRTLACAQLLRAGHVAEIGPLLNASHQSLRDDFEVMAPELDLAVQIMLAFDAVGARCAGERYALGLLSPRQARAGALAIRSAFSGRGYLEPVSFRSTPDTGGSRAH
jgi:galactokinase